MLRSCLFLFLSLSICPCSYGQNQGVLQARFQQLDKSGDGKLTRQEAGNPPWFDRFDHNNDGVIVAAELKLVSNSPSPSMTAKDSIKAGEEFAGNFDKTVPVSLESCRAAADYSLRAMGHAVLVQINGQRVYERYDNGWSADKPHRLASGTKSFAGVSAAAAVADGLFAFDDKVSDSITEWKGDPLKSRITIRQLLTLTSGVDVGDNGEVPTYSQAIEVRGLHVPGKKFQYGPAPFQIFGELMKRKLADKQQMNSLEYLKERVLKPIGMETGPWRKTVDGDPHVPSGAFITAREWVKFGEFLRGGGAWEGKQLVPEKILKELLVGTEVNPSYGITFWLSGKGKEDTRLSDLYMAAGAGKQRLYIIPSLKMVVVRFGESKGRQFDDKQFLGKLITGEG